MPAQWLTHSRYTMTAIPCSAKEGQQWKASDPSITGGWYLLDRHLVRSFLSPTQAAAAAAKSFQLCPTLCDPIDGSPPGSSVPGILQARILEWVAISFSNAWKRKVKGKSLSRVRLFTTPWTVAYQAPPSMGFSRQEYWSGLPLPSPNVSWKALKTPKLLSSSTLAYLFLDSCIQWISIHDC